MEIKNLTEAEIIEKAKKDPECFEPIYLKYYQEMISFINRRVNDQDISFDIVQQVFFNALNHLPKYKDKGHPFSSFLYKIAINECNQFFRNSKKNRYVSTSPETLELFSDEVSPDREIRERALTKALQKLKLKEVNLIELRFFEQRSHKEIGEILGITETNAKVRIHRLVKKIKRSMRDEK